MSHVIKRVMISSTARDLPEHRKEVLEACQRQGFFAERMEDLPAYGATAKDASLKMVDEAEVYVGVFAHRYGYIPEEDNPDLISVTEMEYNRAVETGKPRMIFIIDPAHPITIDQVEHGEGATKLAAFLNRVGKENIVRFFKSPTDLRAEVINSLSQNLKETGGLEVGTKPAAFHYVSDIPAPPETYIAHPYSLLQTHDLIGRRDELNLLTDWVAKPDSEVYAAHILSFVAIGGMGKSALTWKWFNDIAPEEMKPLAGRMWWSFYESDASFENFVIRTLAYVTRRTIDDVREMPTPNREAQLLSILDHEPHLIVMDGLERVLIAYARGDANRLSDTQVSSEKHERKTTDPRVGQFLKKLRRIKGSRILLSTRLHPAELETEGDDPLPGVFKRKLDGLSEDDALELWRAFGVSGSRDLLRPIFDAIERHPLLIQALAGDVKRFRKAPGNFEEWRSCNQQFDPASFPIVRDAMAHMMEYALQDLKESHWNVLSIIAAFRMPTGYPTLVAILVGDQKPCSTEIELDSILVELEDRGLVGWDRLANRYDLHPIVRGVVWSALDEDAKQEIYTSLHAHFELAPKVKYEDVNSIEDLTATIELYNTLIGLGRYDEAVRLFYARLNEATLYRLSSSHERVELLKLLFPDGLEQLPKVSDPGFQAFTVEALAHGYQASGQSKWAVPLYRRNIDIRAGRGDDPNRGIGLRNLSIALRLMGHLRESENAARRALVIPDRVDNRCGRAVGEYLLGLVLAARGEADVSGLALRLSLQEFAMREQRDFEGIVNAHIAQREIWFGGHAEASKFAARGWDLAHVSRSERNFIRAARAQGEAALGLGNLESAEERLLHALTRARCINHSEEELPSLTALAELRRRQGYGKPAREFLDDVWEYAERGPYPLFHADALNVLAQIERDAGNPEEAIKAATQAYRLAWCDGPPFAYHWGLIKAEKHLRELGAPLPDLPPFDESKFEPMPEVEIDPDDEFNANARRPAKRRESSPVKTVVRDQPKVGKNDPCPCDSGKKYKKCCGLD